MAPKPGPDSTSSPRGAADPTGPKAKFSAKERALSERPNAGTLPLKPCKSRQHFESYRSLINSFPKWLAYYLKEFAKHNSDESKRAALAFSPLTVTDASLQQGGSFSRSPQRRKSTDLAKHLNIALAQLQALNQQVLTDYQHNKQRASNRVTEKKLADNVQTTNNAMDSLATIQRTDTEIDALRLKAQHAAAKNELKEEVAHQQAIEALIDDKNAALQDLQQKADQINAIGGELLAYDRGRLLERLLYKPYESFLAFTVNGMDSLGKAMPTLGTTLDASNTYQQFSGVAHGIKQASIWVMLTGLGYMFFDALIHLFIPFFRKRYLIDGENGREVVLEPLEKLRERRRHWQSILKAKLLERGRWMALAFTAIIAVSLVITKVVFNGSFLVINCIHLAGKALYAAIACGTLGYKWMRQKRIIEAIKAEERGQKAQHQSLCLPTIAQLDKDVQAIQQSGAEATPTAEQKKRRRLGKANWFFLIPTFWIPLAISWIVRAASKGKRCDFLVAKEKDSQTPTVLTPLKIEKRKIAEGFRQKIFCLGIKLTLLSGLVVTACSGIPPMTIAIIFFTYGAAHGAYELVRCFTKKSKWRKFRRELKATPKKMKDAGLVIKSLFHPTRVDNGVRPAQIAPIQSH